MKAVLLLKMMVVHSKQALSLYIISSVYGCYTTAFKYKVLKTFIFLHCSRMILHIVIQVPVYQKK